MRQHLASSIVRLGSSLLLTGRECCSVAVKGTPFVECLSVLLVAYEGDRKSNEAMIVVGHKVLIVSASPYNQQMGES